MKRRVVNPAAGPTSKPRDPVAKRRFAILFDGTLDATQPEVLMRRCTGPLLSFRIISDLPF